MSRAAKLAELRALRASGKTRISTYEVAEAESLYDEVDEEGYKKVVRTRLDRDDFVVEDDGAGYADDGREDWHMERRPQVESESDEELPARGKAGELRNDHMDANIQADAKQQNENAKKNGSTRSVSTMGSANTSAPIILTQRQSQR